MAFHQSKLGVFTKNYLVPKITRTHSIYIQNYKAKVDHAFKLELLKVK